MGSDPECKGEFFWDFLDFFGFWVKKLWFLGKMWGKLGGIGEKWCFCSKIGKKWEKFRFFLKRGVLVWYKCGPLLGSVRYYYLILLFINTFFVGVVKDILGFLKMNPFKVLFVIFFFSLSSYVVMGTLTDDSTRAQEKEFDPEAEGDKPLAIDVDVVVIQKQEVQVVKELPARVVALNVSHVRPQIDGVITEVSFEEGSYVEKGQQLYQIDPAIYEAELVKAQSNYQFLKSKKNRFRKLLAIGAVSRQEFQQVFSAYLGAKEELRKAVINVEYSKVYAPISGHIGVSKFTKGALVKASQEDILSVINEIDHVFIDVRYPASDYDIIQKHLNSRISVVMNNGTVLEGGVIDSFEKQIDQSSDSFLVRVKIENTDLLLVPGMYVGAKFFLESKEDLTVPIKATYRDVDGSLFVWQVNEENIVSKRTISANRIFDDKWIIESGLVENEAVIYEGVQKIYEGALINPNVAQGVK